MHQLLSARVLPQTLLGALTMLPRSPSWILRGLFLTNRGDRGGKGKATEGRGGIRKRKGEGGEGESIPLLWFYDYWASHRRNLSATWLFASWFVSEVCALSIQTVPCDCSTSSIKSTSTALRVSYMPLSLQSFGVWAKYIANLLNPTQ